MSDAETPSLRTADDASLVCETTTAALCDWALGAVVPGGAVSVSVYPGHASGARESLAVRALARSLSPSAWPG